jgi:hypothetical protein
MSGLGRASHPNRIGAPSDRFPSVSKAMRYDTAVVSGFPPIRLPTSAPRHCLRHRHVCNPRPPLLHLSATSPPPWTTHKPPCHLMTSSDPDPPDDVMLTSSEKGANVPKNPYFIDFSRFLHFLQKLLLRPLHAFYVQNCTNLLKSTWRPSAHLPTCIRDPDRRVHQVFIPANLLCAWFCLQ